MTGSTVGDKLKNMKSAILLACVGCLALCLFSCGRVADATYGVENDTQTEFTSAILQIGADHGFSFGVLPPGVTKSITESFRMQDTNDATLTWTTEDGKSHSAKLMVTREEFTRNRGVRFIIQPDHKVSVDFFFSEGFGHSR